MKKLILLFSLILTLVGCTSKEKYKEDLVLVKSNLDVADKILMDCSGLVLTAWKNAIYKEGAYWDQNSKYLQKEPAEAVILMVSDIKELTDGTQNNIKTVDSLMIRLKNAPTEYKEAYEECLTYFANVKEMQELNISPIGSYQSYTNRVMDLSNKNKELRNKLNVRLQ